MVSDKLLELLQSFDKYELNRFGRFLRSPYFNENEAIVALYELLNDHLRSETTAELTKEFVWRTLYPDAPYDDLKFRRVCSDMTKLGEDFLGYEKYAEQPATHYNNILQALNRIGLDKHFLANERQLRNLLDNRQPYRTAGYHLEKYTLENEYHLYIEKNSFRKTININLSQADRHLDCYYIAQKLKNYCDAINYKNILSLDVEIRLIRELLEVVKASDYLREPVVAVYYQIMLTLLESHNDAHFQQLRDLLTAQAHIFPPAELRTVYIFAQNYCIKRINTGKLSYFRELFELYRSSLESETIFNSRGQLTLSNYKNLVTVGLANKEYEWVERFIYDYNTRLPKEHRKSALNFNLAHYYFNTQRHHKVIELLRDMEFTDGFDAMSSRWLLLKTYYELNEYDAMTALIDSFSIFLRRNTVVSQVNKQKYLNAVRFVGKITRLSYLPNAKKEKQALLQQLQEARAIVDKMWLLEKLNRIPNY